MQIIGFGALNYDRLYKVDDLNAGDDEIFIKGEHEAPGGSGANTIYALGLLGLSTGFVGAVGGDVEGERVLENFREAGVDLSGITIKSGSRTSLILGFVDKIGERALYVSPRANSELTWEDIDIDYVKRAKILLLSSFVNDAQLDLQCKLLDTLPESIQVVFTPGALYAKKGMNSLKPILSRTSILFINTEEIRILLGKDYWAGSKQLVDLGVDVVAVTLGANGCYLRTAGDEIEVAAIPTKAMDTTGAGDAFAAGFLWAYINKMDLPACGLAGNIVASKCIREMGARSGIPSEGELRIKLEATNKHIS